MSRWLRIIEVNILYKGSIKVVKLLPVLGHCSFSLFLRQSKPKLFLHILEVVVSLTIKEFASIPFFLRIILIYKSTDVPSLANIGIWLIFKALRFYGLGNWDWNNLLRLFSYLGKRIFVWRWAPKCDCFFLFCQFRSFSCYGRLWRNLFGLFIILWNLSLCFP